MEDYRTIWQRVVSFASDKVAWKSCLFPAQPPASFLEGSLLLPCVLSVGGHTPCRTGERISQELRATQCCLIWHAAGHRASRRCALHTDTRVHKGWVTIRDSDGPDERDGRAVALGGRECPTPKGEVKAMNRAAPCPGPQKTSQEKSLGHPS